jgi:hypothetical protein
MSAYVKSETLATDILTGRQSAGHWVDWEIEHEACGIGISKI